MNRTSGPLQLRGGETEAASELPVVAADLLARRATENSPPDLSVGNVSQPFLSPARDGRTNGRTDHMPHTSFVPGRTRFVSPRFPAMNRRAIFGRPCRTRTSRQNAGLPIAEERRGRISTRRPRRNAEKRQRPGPRPASATLRALCVSALNCLLRYESLRLVVLVSHAMLPNGHLSGRAQPPLSSELAMN
jgi:hypothetical protein